VYALSPTPDAEVKANPALAAVACIDASAVVRYVVSMPWTMLTTTSRTGADSLR